MKLIDRLLAYYNRRADAHEAKMRRQAEKYRQQRWPQP